MAETYQELLNKAMALGVKAPTAQQIQAASQLMGIPATTFTEKPQTPIQLPSQPTDTTNYSSIVTTPTNAIAPPAKDGGLPDYLKKYLDESKAPPSGMDAYNKLYDQAGISTKEQDILAKEQAVRSANSELDAINAQLQGIEGTLTSDQLKLRGEGISARAIEGRGINLEREAAIRAIPLQTQGLLAQAKIASAQGDLQGSQRALEMANNKINTIFKIYSDDQDRKYKYQQDLRNVVFEYATKKEQRMLDAQKDQDDQEFQLKRDNLNYAKDLATAAINSNQGGLASQIMSLDPSNPNYETSLAKLAGQIVPKSTATTTNSAALGLYESIAQETIDAGGTPQDAVNEAIDVAYARGNQLTVAEQNAIYQAALKMKANTTEPSTISSTTSEINQSIPGVPQPYTTNTTPQTNTTTSPDLRSPFFRKVIPGVKNFFSKLFG